MVLGVTESWKEMFERSRSVPPPTPSVRQAAENLRAQSQGFQLSLYRLTAPHLPQEQTTAEHDGAFQLRVTLFDMNHQQFFGPTWKSSPQKIKNNKISINKVLYFHTSLLFPSTIMVVELVLLSPRPDDSHQALGQGFTILELFTSRPEGPIPAGDRRLNLNHGSPRVLLHPSLKDTLEYSRVLKIIDGAHLECELKNHPALVPMIHLLPENVLICGDEIIPGLAASPSGTNALLKPQLLKMLPFTLSRLTISLQPSLESFESQLLQLINADCHNTKQAGTDDAQLTIAIQERRLHVGVHNGWGFLDKPQVVVLEPLQLGVKGDADGTSKKNSLKNSLSGSILPQKLGLRSSLELKLPNHPALAIVLQLEYVFSGPIGKQTMLSATSTSRAVFLQCLRWAIFCPFQETTDWKQKEIQLVLQGGAEPNPYGVMVFCSTQSPALVKAPARAKELSEAVDSISFWLSSSVETSSPKTPVKMKQEVVPCQRRSPVSPLRGTKCVPKPSPPDSPQGPGLSLSQLAATSRYPTISHSSSALPWKQSFPSTLHPFPLASAHQLSHVAHSAVSNIAHLEMDLQREKEDLIQDEGEQLQELPFTPVHAPVITLGMNVPRSGSVSSRSSLAHLFSAGFPDIVDSGGQVAEVLDPIEPLPFDPQREEADPLQGNLLVFQFLAFTRMPSAGVGPHWPENIYVTFQFYRFPPVTSQQLKLLTRDKVQQKTGETFPCVLAAINRDGTVNSDSPGLQLQFKVDDTFLMPGEKRWFLRYLALHTMDIDIWDSDSLLLIGSTAIELKYLLRQGKSAVQALHEVEVLTTGYAEEDTNTDFDQQSSSTLTVHTIVRGRLHIRTGNIGCFVDTSKKRPGDLMFSHSHIITPRDVISGFRGGSLSSRHILQHNARNTAQVYRLEIDRDTAPLFRRGIKADTIVPAQRFLNEPDDRRRMLSCMEAVRQRERLEEAGVAKEWKKEAQLKSMEVCSKSEAITNMLCQSITTQHLLYSCLGSAEYMEFVLKNPFNVPQTITIHSEDPELSVITCTEEWAHFKALTKTSTPLEEDMFNLEEGSPGPRVYLRPKESVNIPLKYQSFLCDHTMTLQGPSFLPTGKGPQMAKKNLSNIITAKSIKVTFKGENGKPMAILQVNVEPTPHVVDQTFRLYHPELCFLKKAIRLPPWHNPTDVDPDPQTHISVRCSDPNIICQTRMMVPGEPQDVYIKVPGSPSPNIKMFFVMVYIDKWMAAPSQIWRIYVHFLERVDVSCVTGQRSCHSVVLRGKQALRKVKCYSSHPQEVEVEPLVVFVLPPAAVQELHLKVQPWQAGRRFLYVNAVDVEQHRLITAWMLCLNVHRPVLSKAFEVSIPAGSGSSRKITYTNPYTNSRTFLLRSDHPDLLQFKEDTFQIGGGESYTIGLRFAPSQSPGSAEILVYVNNLQEKTEETFCVKVYYS
ncbi:nephrocystin-4 isoform X2 [Gouania willdenowi]|uniref:Nephrocystin-4 n=1 Tax=Gouania willdenowi TaxID=441366 RepID=A0A8C5DYC1_GOUWI|nr:nephrocystin-4 isoform X2 [Gouania willdenowi]